MPDDPPPPTFPLTRDQFAEALAKGLGRAHLHLQRHGGAGLEDLVLDACLHERAYDPQCEEDRGHWLAALTSAAGLEGAILPALVESLRGLGDVGEWDRFHRCSVAAQFAARSHNAAREALYAAFRESIERDDPVGASDIIALDGAEGLIAVADALGQRLRTNPELEVGEWRLAWFDKKAGPGNGRAILERAASGNPAIRRYLEHVELATREERPPRPMPSLAEIVAAIDDPCTSFRSHKLRRWSRRASENDLEVIANRLRAGSEPTALQKCLMCFERRPYAPLLSRFLELAGHANVDVRRAAVAALSQITHGEVRALALRRVEAVRITDGELRLFATNYSPGDELRFLRPMVVLPPAADDRHRVGLDILSVFEQNPAAVARPCMLWLYTLTPCSMCRNDAVRILLAQGRAPAWLIEEAQFDVDNGTRALCHAARTDGTRPTHRNGWITRVWMKIQLKPLRLRACC